MNGAALSSNVSVRRGSSCPNPPTGDPVRRDSSFAPPPPARPVPPARSTDTSPVDKPSSCRGSTSSQERSIKNKNDASNRVARPKVAMELRLLPPIRIHMPYMMFCTTFCHGYHSRNS